MAHVPPQGFTRLTGSERQLPPNARQIGPVDPNENIEVSIYLRDPAASTDQTQQPGQRLSRAAYRSAHQAAPDDLAKVEAFAQQHQLTVVETDPVTRKVVLAGPAAAMTKAFATELHRYEQRGRTFRGRTGHLHVPHELEPIIVGVFGLDDRPQAHPRFRVSSVTQPIDHSTVSPEAKKALTTSFTPPQVAQIYGFPTDLDGSNECIALIELGGGYSDKDLATYFQQLKLPTPQVVSVAVDGVQNSPSGDPNSADGEVVLDIEVAGSVAPKARIAVYFAPNTDRGFLDAVTQAIHDSTNAPSVISISWGAAEVDWTTQAMQTMDQAFQTAATLGVTVLCASGDNGSSDGVTDRLAHVDFPASSPNVLGCGGTRLKATNDHKWQSEVVWNNGSSGGATGGGVSNFFGLPTWQAKAKVPPSVNDKHVGRGVPDIAGDADPQTGYRILVDGQSLTFGGTSAVAPLWAGLIALLNQKRGQPIGFLNQLLYQNYSSLAQSHAFHDITSGNNGGYSARSGWDACTGLGTPDGKRLLDALIPFHSIPK
jgi:kumamolisin